VNSFISWVGGKKALRDEIVQHFPFCYDRYIEVFGGGGWVLFHKQPRNDFEVYNDFNSLLVNLFRCVQCVPKARRMKKLLRYSLNSRQEFDRIRRVMNDPNARMADYRRAAYYYQLRSLVGEETREWANRQNVMPDAAYGRYYEVDAAIADVNRLVRQTQEAYRSLNLFGREHCAAGMYDGSVKYKVLVLSPDTLKESAWTPQSQLWLATGGFGCDPKASGRAIYATCLGDGEQSRWNREDFIGVLDEQNLPEWAKEKLETLRAPKQDHHTAPAMGGMEMG